MATVVAVMDRGEWGANTDNLVVVNRWRRRLLWVPRDLWCERIRDRINRAFAHGGHEGLIACLADHRIRAKHVVCVRREATERALEGVAVSVPIDEPVRCWYPLEPTRPIEDGRRLVSFDPPREVLSGERIHQWIGARYGVETVSTDIHRIERQKTFLLSLLHEGFEFDRVLAAGPQLVRVSDPKALQELGKVKVSWTLETVGDLVPRRLDGKDVLVREPRLRSRLGRAPRGSRRRRGGGDRLAA